MQRRAIEDLKALLRDKLAAAEILPAAIHGYVTPRRLVVVAERVPASQPDRAAERRGPRVGSPPAAIDGFLRAQGLKSIEECQVRDTERGQFYFVITRRSGRRSAEVLPELISAAIGELPWPKSMRWPGVSLRWVRPLTSIICLYDGEVLPLSIDGVPVGGTSSGHRFLSPAEFCVTNAVEYLEKLPGAYVILDQDHRRELIRADLDQRAASLGLKVKPDPGLLDEVTGLAEFPVVLAGKIDPDYMALPSEVLQTAMRAHQKFFSCIYPDRTLAPQFLFVANNLAEDRGAAIVAGNERVLRARLADARFFWDQDRKVPLASRVEALKQRVYHEKLGTLFDKAERMELLAEFLAKYISGADRGHARRGAFLAKADLSSGMVGEFPELQGVMGRHYARHDRENERVADAIAEHYKPLGPDDSCPSAPESIVVALADKLDALFAFFWINEKPSGSRDPFALRRAGQGIIRIILENGIRLPLTQAFSSVHGIFVRHQITGTRYAGVGPFVSDVTAEVMKFIADRLKVHLREEGVRHDLIAAVFALAEDDLVRLRARVSALQNFLNTDYGSHLLIAYRRASNIVRIEERRDRRSYDQVPDRNLMRQVEERNLDDVLATYGQLAGKFLEAEEFPQAMVSLASLKYPVDEFFDKVTVNVDDAKLRENRLRLLARIRDTMNRIADFSQIEG
jgi:glycyl-tRNA synthetase beta chain